MRALILAAALVGAGCQSHAQTPTPESVTSGVPAASSSVSAPGIGAERQEVLRRFTQEIWPAVNAYNRHPSQGGPAHLQYVAIADKGLDTDAWGKLRDAVHHLGVVRNYDDPQGGSSSEHDLHLAATDVTALKPPIATLRICYTFTALSYPTDWDHPLREPTASEVTVELHKTDDWYLRAISDDHIVSNCPASNSR